MPDAAAVPLDVSVVILTVDRFEMADRTIASVMAQENRLGLAFEVIVVDNSADAASRDRIENWAKTTPHPLRYVHEPRRNIAHARNAGVAASQAEFVAFADDDEVTPPNWLDTMVATARAAAADVVLGPVYPAFEGSEPPAWDPTGRLPVRDQRVATGAPVPAGPTCNILLRAATCLVDPQPFDPQFGKTGGEDVDFTRRLKNRGLSLVWCADSVVTEFQPKPRMTLRYWSRRTFVSSQVYVRTTLRNRNAKVRFAAYAAATGLVQMIVCFVPFLLSSKWPTPRLARLRLAFMRGLGKVFWPFRVNFY